MKVNVLGTLDHMLQHQKVIHWMVQHPRFERVTTTQLDAPVDGANLYVTTVKEGEAVASLVMFGESLMHIMVPRAEVLQPGWDGAVVWHMRACDKVKVAFDESV